MYNYTAYTITYSEYFSYKWSTRLQSMYNHMVGRTASVISHFYSLLPVNLSTFQEHLSFCSSFYSFPYRIFIYVSVMSCNLPCNDGNARFTTVPWKALSIQVWIRYHCFCLFSFVVSLRKWKLHFMLTNEPMKKLTNINTFSQKNDGIIFKIFDQIKVSGVPL